MAKTGRKADSPWKLNIVGQKFGEWEIIEHKPNGHSLCRCSCGVEKILQTSTIKGGRSKSCGCKGSDWCRKHGMEGTSIYNVWIGIRGRCRNINYPAYKVYGAKGIEISNEWYDDFNVFYADMGDRPEGHSLDRIDPNGNYCKENCRWASIKTQARNKKNTIYLEYKGERRPMAEWSELLGLPRKSVEERIRKGWTVERALETPIRHKQ